MTVPLKPSPCSIRIKFTGYYYYEAAADVVNCLQMDAGMGGAGIEQLPSLLSTAAEAAARYVYVL